MKQDDMQFGRTLKVIRTEKGMQQITLAKLIETHASYLSNIEHGRKTPGHAILKKIFKALEIDERYFYARAVQMPRNYES